MGPTNSGKTKFLVNQLCYPFCGKFDNIVLICPTFARTLYRFAETGGWMLSSVKVEIWLKLVSFYFKGTNTLIVLDDCAASKDVKGWTGGAGQTQFFSATRRHQCVGVDTTAI